MQKEEVSKGGVVRIPKSVFEPTPQAAGSSSNLPDGGKKTLVKRLDGTVEEVVTGLPPNNPNFKPRECWPGGRIVTNDKLEVLLKFHERKGLPLTPELQAKKEELEAAAAAAGSRNGNGKGKAKAAKGKVVTLGGSEGALSKATPLADAPPKAAPEVSAWYKNRPKGGVKVLGGAEGGLTGAKRSAENA